MEKEGLVSLVCNVINQGRKRTSGDEACSAMSRRGERSLGFEVMCGVIKHRETTSGEGSVRRIRHGERENLWFRGSRVWYN